MKYLRALVSSSMLLVAWSAAANDRPLPLSPTYITTPPSGYRIGGAAFEGDWMIVGGGAINPDESAENSLTTAAVFLYRRGGLGRWVLQGKLAEIPYFYDWNSPGISLAMENGLLAFEMGGKLYIYERSAAGYTQAAVLDDNYSSRALRIDGKRILAGLGNCYGAAVVEKNAAGAWAISGRLQTSGADCQDDYPYTDFLDFSADYALVATRSAERTTQAFRRVAGQLAWQQTATLPGIDFHFVSTAIGLRGNLALVAGSPNEGTHVVRRADASGATWNRTGLLRTVDMYAGSNGHINHIRERAELWLLDGDLWRQNPDNSFQHLARLDSGWGEDVAGRTVLATIPNGIATYILPATFSASPAPLRDDFQGNGNISWQSEDGGFATAQSGFTRVFRSTQPTSRREATVGGSDWANQSIQVDVRPTAFQSGSSFIGLTVRRTDNINYYQARFMENRVTLVRRTSAQGEVQLATTGVPFTSNHSYRLRFEARGNLLRVFVDEAQIFSVTDSTLTHGSAGLVSSFTLADFDNVVVSPLSTPLFRPADVGSSNDRWTVQGGTWVEEYQSLPRARRQTDRTVAARSLIGVPETDDQIIETVVRIDSLPPSGDRWVGVIARYHDNANLYYASLRVNSRLEIRSVINGMATVLASVPYTVKGNQFYRLRFEAIGDELRVYANGVFLAEAHDTTLSTGRFGVATNLAAASFSELSALQP